MIESVRADACPFCGQGGAQHYGLIVVCYSCKYTYDMRHMGAAQKREICAEKAKERHEDIRCAEMYRLYKELAVARVL